MGNIEWVEARDPCIDCGNKFMRVKQRGRPPVRCPECFEKVNILKVAKASEVVEARLNTPVDHGNRPPQLQTELKLWEGGDVVPTDHEFRPKIGSREAQCVKCNRLFVSDSTCELHKSYTQPVTVGCKPPASIGLVAIEKRGFPIWAKLDDIK